MEFFRSLERLLEIKTPSEKTAEFKVFYHAYKNDGVRFEHEQRSKVFDGPSYIGHCQPVSPTLVLKRRKLSTDKGKAIFLHAIAHIEYSAIDMALDSAYRFKKMPQSYYDDWLSVADDEVRHFELLEDLLLKVNSFYGELPVHVGLFEALNRTPVLHERMAVVPRYLEANGLDATPIMIDKLAQFEDDLKAQQIISVLEIILEEECDHVSKGDRWFKYACDQKGLPYEIYFDIIDRHYPGSFPRKKELNVQARQEAGFSCEELRRMNTQIECDKG